MIRRPPRSTRTYTLLPCPTLCRSAGPWRRLRRLAGAAVVLLLLYGLGFLWFSTLLPSTGSGDERSTDAIVVLTGGSDRLAVALDLLSADKGRKLFVSGVDRKSVG